jgi:hypothetical protein
VFQRPPKSVAFKIALQQSGSLHLEKCLTFFDQPAIIGGTLSARVSHGGIRRKNPQRFGIGGAGAQHFKTCADVCH